MPDCDDWSKCYKHGLTYRGDWCPRCFPETALQCEPDQVDGPKTTGMEYFMYGFLIGLGIATAAMLLAMTVARLWMDQL